MSAPERVWVSPLGVFDVEMGGSVPYVPERRALDAERERDIALAERREIDAQAHEVVQDLRAQVAALTADLDALVPLVKVVDGMAWTAGANIPPGVHFSTASELEEMLHTLTATRDILDRGTA